MNPVAKHKYKYVQTLFYNNRYTYYLCATKPIFLKIKVNNIGMAGFVYITSGKSGKNGPSLPGRYNCVRLSLMSVLLDAI